VSVEVRVPGYQADVNRQLTLFAPIVGTVVLPWWPDEIASSALAGVYETQDRPGRQPLLLRSGDPLPEIRVGCVVSTSNPDQPGNVANVLTALRTLAVRAKFPITVKMASRTGRYRITDLGITELEWDKSGEPTMAEVSLTLTTASGTVIPVGPIRRAPRR
jgi:hypothetical protein